MNRNGVIYIRSLDCSMNVAGTGVRFECGARHLTKIKLPPGPAPGDSVSLRREYNAGVTLTANRLFNAKR